MIDYGPLINPPREPSLYITKAIDFLSLALPSLSAVLSVSCGVLALRKVDDWSAILGIAAGVAGALGVLFTGWASRIRDRRFAMVRSLADLNADMANEALHLHPTYD